MKTRPAYAKVVVAITKEQVLNNLQKQFKDQPDKIQLVLNADPTPNKAYSVWIGKLLKSKNIILPEDASKLQERIGQFNELKKRNKIRGKDITQMSSYQELAKLVDEAMGTQTKGEAYRDNLHNGMQLYYQDEKWKVVYITTVEAASKLCRGTEWCVKDPEHSEDYLSRGPLILVYRMDKPFVLIHEQSGSVKDINDDSVAENEEILNHLTDVREHLGVTDWPRGSELDEVMRYVSDTEALENPAEYFDTINSRALVPPDELLFLAQKYGQEYVLEDGTYESVILEGLLDSIKKFGANPKKYIQYFSDNPHMAFVFANEIGQRVPELEPLIAQSALPAISYAEYVLNGRFPAGEPAIFSQPDKAIDYAVWILKQRLPQEAEASLLQRAEDFPVSLLKYFQNLFTGPWPELEAKLKGHLLKNYHVFLRDKQKAMTTAKTDKITTTAAGGRTFPVGDTTTDFYANVEIFPTTLTVAPGKVLQPVQVTAIRKSKTGAYGHKSAGIPTSIKPNQIFIVSPQPIFAVKAAKGWTPVAPNEPIDMQSIIDKRVIVGRKVSGGNYAVGVYYGYDPKKGGGYVSIGKVQLTVQAIDTSSPDAEFKAIMEQAAQLSNFVNSYHMRIQQMIGHDTNSNDWHFFNYVKNALWRFLQNAGKEPAPEPIVTATVRETWRKLTNEKEYQELQGIMNKIHTDSANLGQAIINFTSKNPRHKDVVPMNQLYSALYMATNNRRGMTKYYQRHGNGTIQNTKSVVENYYKQLYELSPDGRNIDLQTAAKLLRTLLHSPTRD